jgi:hypothetical protein
MTGLKAYKYARGIFEKEFPLAYGILDAKGIVYYEITNILELVEPLICGLDENDSDLRAELIQLIADYLQQDESSLLLIRKEGAV